MKTSNHVIIAMHCVSFKEIKTIFNLQIFNILICFLNVLKCLLNFKNLLVNFALILNKFKNISEFDGHCFS